MELMSYLESTSKLEEFARSRTAMYMPTPEVLCCRVLGRFIFYLPANELSMGQHLAMDGYWESWVTRYLAQTVPHGAVCINVGANLGYYAVLLAALTGPSGICVAVEPNPDLQWCIKRNLYINGLVRQSRVLQMACDKAFGSMMLHWSSTNTGIGTLLERNLTPDYDRSELVKTTTIDLIAENLTHVDLIKMDCEGMDYEVLRGSQEVLATNPRIRLITEVHSDLVSLDYFREQINWLASLGFTGFGILGDGELLKLEGDIPDMMFERERPLVADILWSR